MCCDTVTCPTWTELRRVAGDVSSGSHNKGRGQSICEMVYVQTQLQGEGDNKPSPLRHFGRLKNKTGIHEAQLGSQAQVVSAVCFEGWLTL